MSMNHKEKYKVRISCISLLASANAALLLVSLSGCGSPSLTPEDRAYKRENTLRSKNLFEKEDHNKSYDHYVPEEKKAPPAKPVFTADGLEIQDLEEGFGLSPSQDRMVLVHYTGYLADGTKFDSSRDKGMPFSFVVGKGSVIPGFEQGIMGMKVGGKRKITIPPNLAYGSQGHGSKVPPNATLVYEVELLSSDR